jgi:hypothetical protein
MARPRQSDRQHRLRWRILRDLTFGALRQLTGAYSVFHLPFTNSFTWFSFLPTVLCKTSCQEQRMLRFNLRKYFQDLKIVPVERTLYHSQIILLIREI